MNTEKMRAILHIESLTSSKELKSFLRTIQNIAEILPKVSDKLTE